MMHDGQVKWIKDLAHLRGAVRSRNKFSKILGQTVSSCLRFCDTDFRDGELELNASLTDRLRPSMNQGVCIVSVLRALQQSMGNGSCDAISQQRRLFLMRTALSQAMAWPA